MLRKLMWEMMGCSGHCKRMVPELQKVSPMHTSMMTIDIED